MEVEQKVMYVLVFSGFALFVVLFLFELFTGQSHNAWLSKLAFVLMGLGMLLRFGDFGGAKKK